MKRTPLVSLHQRIRDDIEGRILSSEWPPGHRIPFEHELMAQYGCSRMTVNKVLSMLADNGMIERRRRLGSFVTRPHPHIESLALDIPDISVDVAARGYRYRYRLLERRLRKADPAVAYEVELAAGQELLALHSLHLADDRPFALEQRLIALAAVPGALEPDFSTEVPGSWLLRHVPWTRAQHRISATGADEAQAVALGVPAGTACLVIERQTWRGEQAITWVKQMFLGDSYDLLARFAPGGRK